MIQNLQIALRRMTELDYECMLEWRQDEDVRRFYSNPYDNYTLEKVVRKYTSRVQGKDKKVPIIIQFNDIPVGYLQYYELELEDKRLYGLPETLIIFGMDILIGNKNYRNKGIASQAIQLLKIYLKENTRVNTLVLKLAKENTSAIWIVYT
ncbi:GNAT family N-acetyltransferase [Paenibacillus nasutitermitis]|uniref:N-acetyltransferase n=1 Tax=Paenibacillus nasutitermitis TaxID=1652958 RepID=A0A917E4V3_9BACL|nr:GNAT family N-acetyltransferase [Paenibacillus nasutitermitis]GGE03156.1 N-acetyltransferase [Paenibacillus nasutitermitis]